TAGRTQPPEARPDPLERRPVQVDYATRPVEPLAAIAPALPEPERGETVFDIRDLTARYGSNTAVRGVSMEIYKNLVTAVIGPSGCGKSTFIRCLNRMNDLVPGFSADGEVLYHGVALRRAAAAPLHRARDRRRAGRRAPRRARVFARPDRDLFDRGPDARAEARLLVRDCHAQHAAGRARRRHDRVLQPLAARRERRP